MNNIQKPLIFAHRGASGVEVENSAASFQKAIELGADGLETDVWLLRDGEIILYHDKYIYHQEANQVLKIPKATISEIKALNLSNGEKILTLNEFLESFANKKTKSNKKIQFSIDLQDLNVGPKMIPILEEFGVIDQSILCATSYTSLNRVRKKNQQVRLIISHMEDLLSSKILETKWKSIQLHAFNIQAETFTPEMIPFLKANGIGLYIWDLHTEELLRKYLKFNPDGIYTNFPSLASKIWNEIIES